MAGNSWNVKVSRSYLLRVWEEAPGQGWRVSLKEVNSGEQIGFPDLDTLFDFLKKQQKHDAVANEIKTPYSATQYPDLRD